MTGGTASGRVLAWRSEEGWGVIETGATPGGCWAHFSSVEMDGYRALHVGQQVTVEYEPAAQDGYQWRALRVSVDGAQTQTEGTYDAGNAHSSTVDIEWDSDEP